MVCIAAHAFFAIVGGSLNGQRFAVRTMATNTAQLPVTFLIATAQHHRGIMLQQVGADFFALGTKNTHGIVERRARAEIMVILAWLQHTSSAGLVAIHADVVCEPRR